MPDPFPSHEGEPRDIGSAHEAILNAWKEIDLAWARSPEGVRGERVRDHLDRAERQLKAALDALGLPWVSMVGKR